MYDLFAGGCNVCINVDAENIIANDINYFLIDILKTFQEMELEELIDSINAVIDKWQLSKTNEAGFLALRNHYNALPEEERSPIELYALMCHSFNYQFRFNSNMEFNNPFGRNRSSFNSTMESNLILFHERIKDIAFHSEDFRELDFSFLKEGDFLYADPPYLITTGSYNDGKRGFKGWNSDDDQALFSLLDQLDSQGVKFALSNVTEHKGQKNKGLIKWGKKYHTHRINFDYNNCNYQSKNAENKTKEVLITNY